MFRSRALAITLGLAVCAGGAWGLQKAGILFPDWSAPEKGTYEAPHGRLGTTPTQPWTATTVEAAIGGKPLPGKVTTLVGEIVDYSCYLQVGKHGAKHRDCGQKCIDNGQPIGLLTKDGTLYLLMEEEHHPRRDSQTTFRKTAREHMAHVMEVTGTFTEVAGQRALYVQGYVAK